MMTPRLSSQLVTVTGQIDAMSGARSDCLGRLGPVSVSWCGNKQAPGHSLGQRARLSTKLHFLRISLEWAYLET